MEIDEPTKVQPTSMDSRRELCLELVRRMPEVALGKMTAQLLDLEAYWSEWVKGRPAIGD